MSATTDKAVTVVRLVKEEWEDTIRDLIEAQAALKEADSAARNARSTVKALTAQVREAMGGRPLARCGKAMIKAVDKPGSHGWLTQTNGTTIPYPEIHAYLIGDNQRPVLAEEVKSVTSGREGSQGVEITGEP